MSRIQNDPGAVASAEAGNAIAGRRSAPHSTSANEALRLDLGFRRDVLHLHALGPRPLGEFLAELGCSLLIRTEIESLLQRYRRLSPEMVTRFGARGWR